MKMGKISLCALVLVLMAGCASETPFKPADKQGQYGYIETPLSEGRYRITFVGNSSTPQETVQDYALLRAAELTLTEGYDWFEVADRDSDKKVRTSVDSGFDTVYQTPTYYRSCDLLGNCRTFATGGAMYRDIGVGTATTRTSYKYSIEIVMRKNPMSESANAYDARKLATALRQRLVPR